MRIADSPNSLLLCVVAIAMSAMSGCFGGEKAGVIQLGAGGSSLAVLDPLATPTADPTLVLKSAVRGKFNPGEIIDLIGDGSGEIGKACGLSGQLIGDDILCTCAFRYTLGNSAATPGATPGPGAAIESIEALAVHSESDLMRCLYTLIPSEAKDVAVRIHVRAGNRFSNDVRFDAAASDGLDSTAITSFDAPKRHLCREIVSVPYTLAPHATGSTLDFGSTSMYDPALSEDPGIAVTFNFYATNMGEAMAFHAFQNKTFECAGAPKLSPWGTYSVHSLDGDKIHDDRTQADNSRNRFLLAKRPTGAFVTPVRALTAPGVVRVIGYGAKPIPGLGNTESCPSTAAKPAGTRWVKVWLFRGDITGRDLPSNETARNMDVACFPVGANLTGTTLATCVNTPYIKLIAGAATCGNEPFLADTFTKEFSDQQIRYDFLYVVTPDTITSAQFLSESAQVRKFRPIRKLLHDDINCVPGSSGCKSLNYAVKFGELLNFGNSDTGPTAFPICALQEDTLQ